MSWLFLGVICILFAVTAVVVWQKWVAPWRQIEQLVRQIVGNEHPRTFLVGGGPESKRVGLALENIFARQQELGRQIAGRESGTQTILGAMQDGLLVVDKSLRVTLVNQAFRKLFVLPEISLGAPLLDVVRDATVDRLIEETLRTGKVMQSELVRADSKTNSERDVEISAVPVKDDAGLTTGAVVLFHDITQLKQTDKVRRDFVANVSHELRTPLSILRGYIETRLHEVLYNLLDNALKYSREKGEIRLRAAQHGPEIVLSVTDNGIGINKDDLPRIFERFYRADKARSRELGGTGLGLAIVKHIAQLHGGRVEAESALGKGTTIRVILLARL